MHAATATDCLPGVVHRSNLCMKLRAGGDREAYSILKKIWHPSRFTDPGAPECERCVQSARPKGIRRVGFSSLIFKKVFKPLQGSSYSAAPPHPSPPLSALHPQQRSGSFQNCHKMLRRSQMYELSIQTAQGGTITLAKTFVKHMVLIQKASTNLNIIVIWRLASPP